MDKFKDLWANLSAKKKKWTICIAIIAVLIPLILILSPQSATPRAKTQKEQIIQNVLTDSDTTGVSQNAIAARLRSLADDISTTRNSVDKLIKTLDPDALNKRLLAIEAAQKQEVSDRKTLAARVEVVAKQPASTTVAPVSGVATGAGIAKTYAPPKDGQPETPAVTENNSGTLQRVYESNAPVPAENLGDQHADDKQGNNKSVQQNVPDIETIQQDIKDEPKKNPEDDPAFQTYLPATSIMSGVFISGMDAPTAQNARQDPYPALIRIKKDAILPNRFRADIRECGLLAAGFGDLSSERAYFRSEVITCIREDGAVFEASIDAYAVGEDGKAGVRGRLVTKQGQYLAKALTAGFLQAASQLFSVQSIPTINVNREGESTSSPYQQVMSSQAVQGAAIAGVGGALNRLADFYMKMAGDLFPVIEIDPARSVDFIVQKGVTLKFNKVNSVGGVK